MLDTKRLLQVNAVRNISVVYTLCITFLLLFPATNVPKIDVPSFDKIGHVFMFTLLVVLWTLFVWSKGKKRGMKIWFVLFCAFIYGIIIETIQGLFLETRTADVWDLVANSVGILLGWLISLWIKKVFALKN
ncbi:MAG: VanZ family protein [Flavobacteriaceae bacterium]|nr:VanZ family protein [Flavobacteriaceae bacterium]